VAPDADMIAASMEAQVLDRGTLGSICLRAYMQRFAPLCRRSELECLLCLGGRQAIRSAAGTRECRRVVVWSCGLVVVSCASIHDAHLPRPHRWQWPFQKKGGSPRLARCHEQGV